ncbi:MAG: type I DNA topoisomerase [Bdellovibrionota bacterium]
MSNVLIVESPGKIKTLRKILGPGWVIEASVGHVTELALDGPKRLGFEFKNDQVFTHYVPRGDRGKQVLGRLKKVVAGARHVFLATDPDREGEAIAWHLASQLNLKSYSRVTYTQITEAAIKKALSNPGVINLPLVDSQRARQCLDKLVGFEVSPLLWRSTGGKSAGRVQSATLHLICERERERLNFKPENYWVLKAKYAEGFEAVYEPEAATEGSSSTGENAPGSVPGSGTSAAAEKAPVASEKSADEPELNRVRSEQEANRIAEIARNHEHVLSQIEQKQEFRNPPAPLITSSLQQVAGAKFKFSPKHTMKIAQELYEGIQGKGLITYMRTDAAVLSPEFVSEARQWLGENAAEALPEKAPTYRVKADAQAAHEAIRPTSAYFTPEKTRSVLTPDQHKLYSLIWERAIASQCKAAKLSKTKLVIHAQQTRWVARGTVVLEPGYLRFWKNLEEDKELPALKQGQVLKCKNVSIQARTTTPPPRYSEPRLVQLMERKGIGRPSTYASTIATLKEREYVLLEKLVLAPTELGMATDQALTSALPDLVDTRFTATMEADLDRIAEGKLSWQAYLIQWNRNYLDPALRKARQTLREKYPQKPAGGPNVSA